MGEGAERFKGLAANDDLYCAAAVGWKSFNKSMRAYTVEHIAGLHDHAYSSEDFTYTALKAISFYHEPDGLYSGVYHERDERMEINTAYCKSFLAASQIVAHEKRHHHLHQLRKKFRQGALAFTSPLHRQGELLAAMRTEKNKSIYVEPDICHAGYWAHPDERNAYYAERAATQTYHLIKQQPRMALEEFTRA